MTTSLRFHAIRCTQLKNVEVVGRNDVYVIFEFAGTTLRTDTIHESGESAIYDPIDLAFSKLSDSMITSGMLTVTVMDSNDVTKDSSIGKATLSLGSYLKSLGSMITVDDIELFLPPSMTDSIRSTSIRGPKKSGIMGLNFTITRESENASAGHAKSLPSSFDPNSTALRFPSTALRFPKSPIKDMGAYVDMDPYDEPELKGKLRWKEGRYKLGRKQFLSNPYIFIPGKMMLQPSFNFSHIFKDLSLSIPSLIFKLSRSLRTSTWNVRLPHSRRHLADAYKILRDAEKKQGGNTNEGLKLNPQHTDLLIDQDIVSKHGKEGLVKKLKFGIEAVTGKSSAEESAYLKNLRGSIDHYHSVLDENCRRILRNTNSACIQAQTLYCVNDLWSDEVNEDVVAQWVFESNPKGATPNILGIAEKTDFHPDVWAQLRDGCVEEYAQKVKDGREPDEIIIDPQPFLEGRIPVEYDPVTGHALRSIPHPSITHLVITDNRILLEQKMAEVVLWGVMLINGGIRETELAVEAIQNELPVIAFKYTGGAADIMIEMHEKVDKWVSQKRNKLLVVEELPPKPFPDDIAPGFWMSGWLKPFDQQHVVECTMMNLLVENWPDRHNKASVFVIDMFDTPEDEIQDKLTQTVGAVAGGDYELGGVSSEQRRISYVWRLRHKFLYNALIYRIIADLLEILELIVTLMSTLAATLYTWILFVNSTHIGVNYSQKSYVQFSPTETNNKSAIYSLGLINILLPLISTVLKGINSAINPYMKYVALTNASVRMESEIYGFRCKVGQYSALKQADDDEDEEEEEGEDGGDNDEGDDAGQPNPRRAFWQAVDKIIQDVASSDLQKGTIRSPFNPSKALDDINGRIRSNRREQETYLQPMRRSMGGGADKEDKKVKGVKAIVEEEKGCWSVLSGILSRGAKVASSDSSVSIAHDDGVSPLSADDYVILRVIPMVAYMTTAAPTYSYFRFVVNSLNVLFSVCASALTAFALIPFIPAVLALSGFVTAMSQYYQVDLRLLQSNSSRSKLHALLVWWESLSLIEKRVEANKTILVKKCEAAIQAQATIFQGGGGGGGGDDDSGGDK